jgi:iron complex transport system substrate-binding protein
MARRIISLACTHTETLHALGVSKQLVGVDCFSDWPQKLVNGLPQIDPWFADPDAALQKIRELDPDLLVLSYPFQQEVLKASPLDGVEVVTLDAPVGDQWMHEMFNQYRLLGDKTGAGAAAEAIINEMKKEFGEIKASLQDHNETTPTFFLEMDHELYTAGEATLVSRVLTDVVGMDNCVAGHELYPQLRMEDVLELQPDLWFVAHKDEQTFAESQPDAAAKFSAEIHQVNADAANRWTPRLVGFAKECAAAKASFVARSKARSEARSKM